MQAAADILFRPRERVSMTAFAGDRQGDCPLREAMCEWRIRVDLPMQGRIYPAIFHMSIRCRARFIRPSACGGINPALHQEGFWRNGTLNTSSESVRHLPMQGRIYPAIFRGGINPALQGLAH
jgi:hypothetical protein